MEKPRVLSTVRLEIHNILETFSEPQNVGNIYYQPPANVSMDYPCMIYNFGDMDPTYADDIKYFKNWIFNCTAISRDIDDPMFDSIIESEQTQIDRKGIVDGLHHIYFTIQLY